MQRLRAALEIYNERRRSDMDEPFGTLDFIAHLKMQAALTRIWQAGKKTTLFVTHDIEEAVQLADRVLVMNNRSTTIQTAVSVDLPRLRDLDSHRYIKIRDRMFVAIGMSLRVGENGNADRGRRESVRMHRLQANRSHEGSTHEN
jgi:NitT/TauT family transport system ATP-binding protein